jgi:hypothetical protein
MSVELLEIAAAALDDLVEEVVFVGAATLALWLTDQAARSPDVTVDVDVVVEIASRPAMHRFERRLREHEFVNDVESELTCRWIHGPSGLSLDVMPTEEDVLGFASPWQAAAIPHAELHRLASGKEINCATPPYLLAMKLEAFADRGNNDYLGGKDFADIVTLIDGRAELIEEVANADPELREFIAAELGRQRFAPTEEHRRRFTRGLYFAMPPNSASQQRVDLVLLPRIDALIHAAGTDN